MMFKLEMTIINVLIFIIRLWVTIMIVHMMMLMRKEKKIFSQKKVLVMRC